MKRIVFILLLISQLANGQRSLVAGWNENRVKVLSSFWLPCMIYLPSDYYDGAAATKRYPVIFSFSGSGEVGSDTVAVLNTGIPKNISNNGSTSYTHEGTTKTVGTDTPTANDKNGNSRTAIIIAVQASSYGANPSWFPYMFPDVTSRFRVDSSMVYLYGYSAGNWAASGIISNNTDTTYNRYISAIVVNSGATQDLTWTGVRKIADRRIPTLLVVGGSDISYRDQMIRERDTINNNSNPDVCLYEEVSGQGHSGFDANALASKTWTVTGGKNFYQFMFQYANTYATTWAPSGGGSPVANSGADQTLYMPLNTATLSGGSSTGTITSIQWTKISGGVKPQEGAITNATSLTATATNLGVGTYTYELAVSDGSTTSKDTVVITGRQQKSRTPSPNFESFTLTVASNEIYYTDIMASFPTLNGGDTLIVPSSVTGVVQLYGAGSDGGWGGDSLYPVVIRPATGSTQITIGNAMRINGQYIRVMGEYNQSRGVLYGFKFNGSTQGIVATTKHSNLTVKWCEFTNVENGCYWKSQIDSTNALSYYPHWKFKNDTIQYCKIYNTQGEAMYIGHTFFFDQGQPASGYQPVPHDGLYIANDTVLNAGWDGIQISNSFNTTIKNCYINTTGVNQISSQMYGIIFGGLSWGTIEGNTIKNAGASGISVFGKDTVRVLNNTIDSCALASVDGAFTSIYINDNNVSGNPYSYPALIYYIQGNCIQNMSSTYSGGAAIRSTNSNGTTRASDISGNTIYDPTGRSLSSLIYTVESGTTKSNTLGQCVSNYIRGFKRVGKRLKFRLQ